MNIMRTLLLVFDKNYTFFPHICQNDITIENTWSTKRFNERFSVRACGKIPFLSNFILSKNLGKWKNQINSYDKIIIFDTTYNEALAYWLKRRARNAKIYVYLWDKKNRERLRKNCAFPLYSYNRADEKYNMRYNPLFYCKELWEENNVPSVYQNDIFYAGRIRGRSKTIENMVRLLEKCPSRNLFWIVDDKKQIKSLAGKPVLDEIKPYEDLLVQIRESKSILEIINEGENGAFTLRILEAIFLNRKLLTNNSEIRNAFFYNESQFFIIDEKTTADGIMQFMEAPLQGANESVINYFDVHAWIERFESNE